jgi:hypothetical protein
MRTLTKDELESMGMTFDMVRRWAEFYRDELARNPSNASARGRAALMDFAMELLGGEP